MAVGAAVAALGRVVGDFRVPDGHAGHAAGYVDTAAETVAAVAAITTVATVGLVVDYIAAGSVCIKNTTIKDNEASASNDDVFGVFTICP